MTDINEINNNIRVASDANKYANFKVNLKTYQRIRILAATEDVPMAEIYRRAAEEYVERHGIKSIEMCKDRFEK